MKMNPKLKMKRSLTALAAPSLLLAQLVTAEVGRTERVLVALESGGAVILDARHGSIVGNYATGPNAFGALYSPNGKRAFVTDKDQGLLIEIDPKSNQMIDRVFVGNHPQQPAMTSSGRIYIPLSGDASIAVVNGSSKIELVKTIAIGTGTKPHIVSLSPDEKTLWATVQGIDPKVVSINVENAIDVVSAEFRYNLFPRVVSAGNGSAYFTAHHSTGIHKALLEQKTVSTVLLDRNGSFSEAAKQIEGISVVPSRLAYTHEGRKALVAISSSQPTCDISPLADKPYWVSLDSMGQVAFVSIPGKALVEAYDVLACNKTPLWSVNVGGKAKRLALSEVK